MSARDAVTALRRFGLGARPGEVARIAGDPRGFLLQGLTDAGRVRIDDPTLEPSHVVFAAAMEAQRQQRLAQASAKDTGAAMKDSPGDGSAMPPAPPAGVPASPPDMQSGPAAPPGNLPPGLPKAGQIRRDAFIDEAVARFRQASTTDAAFLERLVMFWSNHFCVSANKGPVRGIAGAYEREAIRPFVLGRFADMLLAVEKHPAMLIYLDNQQSVGPNSRAGTNRGLGLNENLAREILELHTLGVGGGYSQEDVTNLARILTGWTVGNLANALSEPGKFFFAAARHEPGERTVVGKRYSDRGVQSGEEVLRDLAAHPATAAHIARKLAQHFVAEAPPPALVARLEKTFLDTGGDLGALAKTLATSEEAWQAAAHQGAAAVRFPDRRRARLQPAAQTRRDAAALRHAGPAALAAAVAGGLAGSGHDLGGPGSAARAAAHRRGGGAPGRPLRRPASRGHRPLRRCRRCRHRAGRCSRRDPRAGPGAADHVAGIPDGGEPWRAVKRTR